jgi:hypothetical protein
MLIVLISLSVIFFLLFAYNVYKHHLTLMGVEGEDIAIDTDYNAVKSVMKTYETLIKFSIRRFVKNYSFTLHYVHLFAIKIMSQIQNFFDFIYAILRNSFVKKSIENKTYVKHFWGNLKEFKKEMDEVDGDSK